MTKVALITGASTGIGEAFARRLAAAGHHLMLVARNGEKLQALSQQLMAQHKVKVYYQSLDLSIADADQQLVAEVADKGLDVDLLINNAGIGSAGDFTYLPLAGELRMMQLNMQTLVALTHHYLIPMRIRKQGTVINVASMACFQPSPFMATYAASKAFVRSFTEAVAEENSPFNIQVMLLCPGATETSFFDNAQMKKDDRQTILGNTQLQTPEQVVTAALKGLQKGKRITISGSKNLLLMRIAYFFPNKMITRIFAKAFRPHFQQQASS
ncbi:SDR family NAD(P)-dependent oxidoreductase [Chitinophaga pinensis]|uniref:Short-chain dehydrogenase/reductase SDR n=1 Tax=Chitinophaga pinensis (strain ATCC 43595 / DSM 2588 / LMG 13176 / NBRC 15968 / NCIMB 11800 / UQM 2034) TaxID=485918 RepID=A0A979G639_CHIPD|nr:SDR family oxidoreductase [Chitinophaga pinensis]ACU61569.1 short-chain dehydrogenase/reductase SDR [Chitinophaga pinensis DSM 2588]